MYTVIYICSIRTCELLIHKEQYIYIYTKYINNNNNNNIERERVEESMTLMH